MAKKSVKKPSRAKAKPADVPEIIDAVVEPVVDAPISEPQDVILGEPKAIQEADTLGEPESPETAEIAEDDGDSAAQTEIIPEPKVETRRASPWPLLLGGVAAAVFGFLAARADLIDTFLPPSLRAGADQTALTEDLETANAQITRLQADIKTLSAQISEQPGAAPDDALQALVLDLNDRIALLEKRPTSTGTASSSEYDAAFAAMQETAAAQQAEIDKLLADARLVEKSTEDTANSTLARAAATRIIAAIETGAPFGAALNDLEAAGVADIPQELRDAAAVGVTQLAALQADIPDVARAALAASRSADGENSGGVSGFLKRTLGARSVEPREGTDPDAVLSRIEAAVRNGRLTDALAEAEILPPEGQAVMADWLDQARTRNSVMSASETLMQRLAAN